MKVRLNLATAPLENKRRFISSAGLAGAVAIAALVFLSVHLYRGWRVDREMRRGTSRLEAEIVQFQKQRRDLDKAFQDPQTHQVMDRAAFLNSLIQQRSFPWTQIFMDLERELPEGVRVVNIAPRMHEGRVEVKLVVGASSDESKVKFLKTLEESPEFSRIQVQSETRPTRPGETDQVVLELVAWYKTL